MPRKQMKKTTTRKPSVRKAKQIVKRRWNKMAKTNQDTWSYKFVSEFVAAPINTGATAPGQPVNYISFQQPLALDSSSRLSSYANLPEYKLYANQYDRVRINSVTVEWIPRANLSSILDAASGSLPQTGDMSFHTAIDRDGPVAANEVIMQRYSSYKKFSIFRRWSRTLSMTYPVSFWLNTAGLLSDTSTLQSIGGLQFLGIYAKDLPYSLVQPPAGNTPFGHFKVTYRIVFQGKVNGNLSVDDDGNVIVGPHAAVLTLPETPLTRVETVPIGIEVPLEDKLDECCPSAPKAT